MTKQAGWEEQLWLDEWRAYIESMEEEFGDQFQDERVVESVRPVYETGEVDGCKTILPRQ